MPLVFSFSQLCGIYPQLDENFWGVYAYVLFHMQLNVCFEICYMIYIDIHVILSQDSNVKYVRYRQCMYIGMSSHFHMFYMCDVDT